MTGPVVTGSPFSADATTTVVQTLGDGTRIEQRATAKFYRDGTGRVRRELTVIGLDALNPSAQPRTVITFDSVPGDAMPYTLDPAGRTARRVARGCSRAMRSALSRGLCSADCRWRSRNGWPLKTSGSTICVRRRSS